jgi:hypothetical protein
MMFILCLLCGHIVAKRFSFYRTIGAIPNLPKFKYMSLLNSGVFLGYTGYHHIL